MSRLLRFESRKLFRMVSLYVCLGILVLLIFINIYTTYSIVRLAAEEMPAGMAFSELDLGTDGRGWLLTIAGQSNLMLLLGIFSALFLCADYMQGSAKNVLGRGFSRLSYAGAKLIAAEAVALLFYLVTILTGYAVGSAFFGAGKGLQDGDLTRLAVQLLSVMAYAAFFAFFSLLIRKSGGAIAVNVLVPSVISLALTLADVLIEEKKIQLSEYWLDHCIAVSTDIGSKSAELGHAALVAAVYLVLFLTLSCLISRKQEV